MSRENYRGRGRGGGRGGYWGGHGQGPDRDRSASLERSRSNSSERDQMYRGGGRGSGRPGGPRTRGGRGGGGGPPPGVYVGRGRGRGEFRNGDFDLERQSPPAFGPGPGRGRGTFMNRPNYGERSVSPPQQQRGRDYGRGVPGQRQGGFKRGFDETVDLEESEVHTPRGYNNHGAERRQDNQGPDRRRMGSGDREESWNPRSGSNERLPADNRRAGIMVPPAHTGFEPEPKRMRQDMESQMGFRRRPPPAPVEFASPGRGRPIGSRDIVSPGLRPGPQGRGMGNQGQRQAQGPAGPPAAARPAPPVNTEPRNPNFNDVEIVVIGHVPQDYAMKVESGIKLLGISVDVMFPDSTYENKIGEFIQKLSLAGTLFAIVIRPANHERTSVTTFVLKGSGKAEEHRNMPLISCYALIGKKLVETRKMSFFGLPQDVRELILAVKKGECLSDFEFKALVSAVKDRWKQQHTLENRGSYFEQDSGFHDIAENQQRVLEVMGVTPASLTRKQVRQPQPAEQPGKKIPPSAAAPASWSKYNTGTIKSFPQMKQQKKQNQEPAGPWNPFPAD